MARLVMWLCVNEACLTFLYQPGPCCPGCGQVGVQVPIHMPSDR